MMQASGVLTLADNESMILAEAQGTFLPLAPQVVDTIMQDFPGLRDFIEHLQYIETRPGCCIPAAFLCTIQPNSRCSIANSIGLVASISGIRGRQRAIPGTDPF